MFSDFKLGMGVVVKAVKDWRGVGRLKLQPIRKYHVFPLLQLNSVKISNQQISTRTEENAIYEV